MTITALTREAQDSRTNRTPTAWTADRGDDAQSQTFRALAWSQEDDSLPEPIPYIGDEDLAPETDSRPRSAEVTEQAAAPRYRRSTLLYGIAAGFAAAALGGLVLSVVNTDGTPASTSPVVIQPAQSAYTPQNVSVPQPSSGAGKQGGAVRAPATAPASGAGSAARAVPAAANTPVNAMPTVAAVTPDAPPSSAPEAKAPEVKAPEVKAPEVRAPEVTTPEVTTPQVAAPEVTTPQAAPPVLIPPVVTLPVVSVPAVAPQPVLHPVVPPVVHVPDVPLAPLPNPAFPKPSLSNPSFPALPLPDPSLAKPGASAPAGPAVSNPVTLNPGVTLAPVLPVLSAGAGH